MIAGLVLAAGDSTRMGSPKALLPIGSVTLLGQVVAIAQAADLAPLHVVTGSAHAAITARHPELVPLLRRNPHPELGQLSSLRVGLEALPGEVEAAVVLLVDHPLVRAETVRALARARRAAGAVIAVPVYAGRRGHPVLFGREVFPELRGGSGEEGARAVVNRVPSRVFEVAVEDEGIHIDLDCPAAYARVIRRG